MTVGSGDRGATAELIEKEIAAMGATDNLADICPHQASHGGRGREVNQLFPHSLNDIGDREDFHALRSLEQRSQRFYALRQLPGLLAEVQRSPVVELPDCAAWRDRRLDLRRPAEHATPAEPFVQDINMGNAVQERQDIAGRRHGRRN